MVIAIEIVGGLCLLLGWNTRLATIPLAFITIIMGILVGLNDTGSLLHILSFYAHIAAIGIYTSMIFLGSGRWSLDHGLDYLHSIEKIDGNFSQRMAHDIVTGSGRNFGIFLLRTSIAFFFSAVTILGLSDESYQMALPDNDFLRGFVLFICFLGSISVFSGFRVDVMGWVLAALTMIHFIFIGFPEAWVSQIGLINALFHGLILAALLSLRVIKFGSDLEIGHILNHSKKNVVIIGGGFAGTTVAKKLERNLPSDWQTVLISEENYTTFNPMLAEIVGATVMPSHVIAPIRRMVQRTRFIMGKVEGVDFKAKTITYACDEYSHTIPYEHVVFALGSRANLDIIPGMAQHALPFKLLGDAFVLRNRVIEQLEQAEQETDSVKRRFLCHFIVIGGGFSGVEVAGAIQDFIQSSKAYYPRLSSEELQVSIIHNTALPLPELGSEKLGIHTRDSMLKRGMDIHLGAGVTSVDANGVVLGDGTRVDGGTIICSIGTKPNPLIAALQDITLDKGRVAVNADMSAQGVENTWALGDCAFVPNADDGKLSPPTAQFAVQQGQQLARNIASKIKGGSTRPFAYTSKGSMATIGHLNGVADLKFMKVTGLLAWLIWRAFYLSLMPTFAKKTRIFFEWTWSMLFSSDIVHLRFTTSQAVDTNKNKDA